MYRRPERITDTPWRTGAAVQPRSVGDRPVSGGEDQPVTLWDQRRGAPRLRPGPLLDQEELTAGVIGAGLAEVDHHLEREHFVPVQVAVQRVPAARLVAQQDRRRPGLPGRVADVQPLIERVRPLRPAAEPVVPVAGDRQQPPVQAAPQRVNRLGERRREVAVLAFPEPVARHVDRGAEVPGLVVEPGDPRALGRGQQRGQQRAAVGVEPPRHAVPVRGSYAFGIKAGCRRRGHHAASKFSSDRLASGPPA